MLTLDRVISKALAKAPCADGSLPSDAGAIAASGLAFETAIDEVPAQREPSLVRFDGP